MMILRKVTKIYTKMLYYVCGFGGKVDFQMLMQLDARA